MDVQEVRHQFGPEYDRAVEEQGGDEQKAATLLRERRERVENVEIHPLSPAERDQFAESWKSVQAEFVDDPSGAVNDADALIANAMRRIGYLVDQYEQREPRVAYGPLDGHSGIIRLRADGDRSYRATRSLPAQGDTVFSYLVGRGVIHSRLGDVPGNPVVTIRSIGPVVASHLQPRVVRWVTPAG